MPHTKSRPHARKRTAIHVSIPASPMPGLPSRHLDAASDLCYVNPGNTDVSNGGDATKLHMGSQQCIWLSVEVRQHMTHISSSPAQAKAERQKERPNKPDHYLAARLWDRRSQVFFGATIFSQSERQMRTKEKVTTLGLLCPLSSDSLRKGCIATWAVFRLTWIAQGCSLVERSNNRICTKYAISRHCVLPHLFPHNTYPDGIAYLLRPTSRLDSIEKSTGLHQLHEGTPANSEERRGCILHEMEQILANQRCALLFSFWLVRTGILDQLALKNIAALQRETWIASRPSQDGPFCQGHIQRNGAMDDPHMDNANVCRLSACRVYNKNRFR
ncbi:uncharacterized protein UDID_18098 [Ustilago sp. UG-2017a]|nr:uncharacterized protein UDID_18098 [Ustilago sp. UG-2017a]